MQIKHRVSRESIQFSQLKLGSTFTTQYSNKSDIWMVTEEMKNSYGVAVNCVNIETGITGRMLPDSRAYRVDGSFVEE